MKDAFEGDIKRKLEGLDPEALGYALNKERLWQQIEQKQKRRAIRFPSWISHTAAVAAGLLIGVFLLNRAQRQEPVVAGTAIKPVPPKEVVRTDTVYVLQAPQQQRKENTRVQPSTVAHAKAGQQAPELVAAQQEPGNVKESTPLPEAIPQQTLAIVKPTSPKVLHLLDMGNENATLPSKTVKTPAIFQILSNYNQPDQNQVTVSMMVRQQWDAAKN